MASSQKLSDPEIGAKEMETEFNQNETESKETDRFIEPSTDNAEGKAINSNSADEVFYGLSREELEKYADDPKWKKVRIVLFVIFVICWAAMLIAAIVIVVVTPKCPAIRSLSWYQSEVMYQVDVEKFKDSNGDGKGDIAGVKEKMSHFEDIGVKTLLLTNYADGAGDSPSDLAELTKDFKKKDIRVVMELYPTATDEDELKKMLKQWTDSGAEGFTMDLPAASDEKYLEVLKSLQNVLDSEYNKFDDRDRIIIGRDGLKGASTAFYTPSNCSDVKCIDDAVNAVASVDLDTPWKIMQLPEVFQDVCAVCRLTVKLTMPGTPHVMYGDEMGLESGKYMKWDDDSQQGFTTSNRSRPAGDLSAEPSVLAQQSSGFDGVSSYNLFKALTTARKDSYSLQWGRMFSLDFAEGTVAYVRRADGFPPVVVAINHDTDGKAGSLVYTDNEGEYSSGKILAASGVSLDTGNEYDMSAVYLPAKSVVVAELSQPASKE